MLSISNNDNGATTESSTPGTRTVSARDISARGGEEGSKTTENRRSPLEKSSLPDFHCGLGSYKFKDKTKCFYEAKTESNQFWFDEILILITILM